MGFAEEARNTDAELMKDICLDLLGNQEITPPEEFFDVELDRADEIPILKGLADVADDVDASLRGAGLSQERIEGVIAGFAFARVAIRNYISVEEEIPDGMPVEGI